MTEPADKEAVAGPMPVLIEAQPKPPRRLAAVLALLLALLALGVALAGGYYLWERLQRLEASQQHLVTDTKLRENTEQWQRADSELRQGVQALGQEASANAQTLAQLRQRADDIDSAQEAMQQRLAKLDVETQARQGEWLRAEAAYLTQLAVARIDLQRDVDGGLAALKLADQLLTRLNSGSIAERQAIHRAINRLVEVNLPDIDRLAGRLEAIISRIDILPLDQQLDAVSAQQPEQQEEPALDGWQARLDRAWRRFRDTLGELVIVQRREPVEPLLPPEEQYFLYHNLRLQLEAARLALIEGDVPIYQRSLDRARDWIRRYYALGEPGVESVLAEITALRAIDIRPELPSLADLLKPASGG